MNFHNKTLELPIILDQISQYAKTLTTKDKIQNLQPMSSIHEIERALFETDVVRKLLVKYGLIPLLDDFDITRILEGIKQQQLLSIEWLMYLRLYLKMERDVLSYFINFSKETFHDAIIKNYISQIVSHDHLLSFLNVKLDEEGLLFDDASDVLFDLRKQLSNKSQTIHDRLNKMLVSYRDYLNEALIVVRNDHYCLPIKEAFKNKVKGVIHDVSASGQTLYIEPEIIVLLQAELDQLKRKEALEIARIIEEISAHLHPYGETLYQNMDIFLMLDLLQAKAFYAQQINATKPHINQQGIIHLIQARHPLIDPKKVVPIEVSLDQTARILMITGSNTGGKTVALKTVGLLTLMMQSGLLIPASENSNMAVFGQVYADIGDEQSILQSLSTFSSHLSKLIFVIKNVKNNALLLLDEIGSGTDPIEGVSLAIAILDELQKKDVRMMVTTHYSELKEYAYANKHMRTASVKFDTETLEPLYSLQMDTLGSSHALLIAKRLGLKESIIEDAKRIYSHRQTDLAKMMDRLEQDQKHIENERQAIKDKMEQLEAEKKSYHQMMVDFKKKEVDLLERMQKEQQAKWQEKQFELEEALEKAKSSQSLNTKEIADIKQVMNTNILRPTQTTEEVFKIGDQVYIIPYEQYGEITGMKKDMFDVHFGQFTLQFKQADLTKYYEKEKKTQRVYPKKRVPEKHIVSKAKFEIDLRGFRYEDVKNALDEAIDQALLNNLSTLRIIHGFGTFVIRDAVQKYLKTSKYVKSFRYGGEGEGLNGVTIVTLK